MLEEIEKQKEQLSGKKVLLIKFYETGVWNSVVNQTADYLVGKGALLFWCDAGKFRTPKLNISEVASASRVELPNIRPLVQAPSTIINFLESEIHSIFRDKKPVGFLVWITRIIYARRAAKFATALHRVLSEQTYNTVVIPNGRTGITAIAANVCRELGIRIIFVETNTGFSSRSGNFFFEDYSVHSRVERQESLQPSGLTRKEEEHLFLEWLGSRMSPDSNSNPYSARWATDQEAGYLPNDYGKGTINLFLTSSSDEHWGLGGDWNFDKWQDYYSAIAKTITLLKQIGEEEFVVRVHPNLAAKSVRHVREEVRQITTLKNIHPEVNVIGPLSSENTYQLLADSKRVFVSLSSAGLEASGLGIPVWCYKPTGYDLKADVRRLWSEEDLTEEHLGLYRVDTSRAWSFFASMNRSGLSLRKDTPQGNQEMISSVVNRDLPLRLLLATRRKMSSLSSKAYLLRSFH